MLMKEGLAPIIDGSSRILILGSLPGDTSLCVREYYANPRNHFWRILSCIYDEPTEVNYESKKAFLRRHGIALWDVLKAAERKGSLDTNIRRGSENINDVECLIQKHPMIRTIGLNGTKTEKLFNQNWRRNSIFSADGMQVRCLPSSSSVPGKNVKSFEEKIRDWQEFVALAT